MNNLKLRLAELLKNNFTQAELNKMFQEFNLDDWLEILDLTESENNNA